MDIKYDAEDEVDFMHEEYKEEYGKWDKCRSVHEGGDKVKEEGVKFLAKLEDQSTYEYENYKGRALFYEAVKRTVNALIGTLFQKEPHINYPEDKNKSEDDNDIEKSNFFNNISLWKQPFNLFLKDICREVIIVGRIGILVDRGVQEKNRVYSTIYKAENIINWRTSLINDHEVLTLVVLQEIDYELGMFRYSKNIKYRVLRLEEDDNGKYFYVNEEWIEDKESKKSEDKKKFKMTNRVVPVNKGVPFDFIPFWFINSEGTTSKVNSSPILGLANANISHYQNSADLEHGRHFVGLPTAWIAGFPPMEKEKKYKIGSSVAWMTSKTDAKAGFLEFTGQGLKSLETALREKENLMAILGARLLEMPKPAVEASESQRIRKASENSILADISDNVSIVITEICKFIASWTGIMNENEISVSIQKDYSVVDQDPQVIAQLLQLYMNGLISLDTFYYNLTKMQVMPVGRTVDMERQLIEFDMSEGRGLRALPEEDGDMPRPTSSRQNSEE